MNERRWFVVVNLSGVSGPFTLRRFPESGAWYDSTKDFGREDGRLGIREFGWNCTDAVFTDKREAQLFAKGARAAMKVVHGLSEP